MAPLMRLSWGRLPICEAEASRASPGPCGAESGPDIGVGGLSRGSASRTRVEIKLNKVDNVFFSLWVGTGCAFYYAGLTSTTLPASTARCPWKGDSQAPWIRSPWKPRIRTLYSVVVAVLLKTVSFTTRSAARGLQR